MKKILRYSKVIALAAIILGGVNNIFAQEVTLDFTNAAEDWNITYNSKNKGNAEESFTNGTYTIKLAGDGTNGYGAYDGYILMGKKGAYLTLPTFSFDVETIEVVGKSGASGSTKQNIFVGEVAVSTETTGATGTNKYTIAEEYQTVGNSYTLKVTSAHNTQITAINVYKKGSGSVDPVVTYTYNKATTIESGKSYLIAANVDGTLKVATPVTSNYGYLSVVDATDKNNSVELTTEANEFTITSKDDGYTIAQSDGRYWYQTGTYNSFNVAAEPTEGEIWTITANGDGTFKITNTAVNKYVQYSAGYSSFGSYSDEQGVMPCLYVKSGTSGISNITADTLNENAPIYNLAGQRVNKATKGILIQNGKKFINK